MKELVKVTQVPFEDIKNRKSSTRHCVGYLIARLFMCKYSPLPAMSRQAGYRDISTGSRSVYWLYVGAGRSCLSVVGDI